MRPYEVMVIFDASTEDGVIRKSIEAVSGVFTSSGAQVRSVEYWGRRRFAYEINHKTEGFYVLIEVRAESAVVTEVDRTLGLADNVLRHKIIRIPEHVFGKASAGRAGGSSRASSSPSKEKQTSGAES